MILGDERLDEMTAAAYYLAKTKADAFAPELPELFAALREMRKPALSASAEEAWARGPNAGRTEHEINVWDRWGGAKRYGALPDPKYCKDSAEAEKVISFARREFIDLFHTMEQREGTAITRQQANAFLEQVQARAPGIKKLTS